MSSINPIESKHNKHALVVDQHPTVRDCVKCILSNVGFRVTECDDGREALAIATKWPCLDLLVSETEPPGLDGWALATSFVNKCPLGRVIMMPAADVDVEIINCQASGEWQLVPKARLADLLLETIESVGLLQQRHVILVAEDDPMVRNVVQAILARAGHAVIAAKDGQEALELSEAYAGQIDLVISDIEMPRMNGAQLAERIRKERPGIPFLMMSGLSYAAPPGVPLIEKPFDLRAFSAKVHQILGIQPKAER